MATYETMPPWPTRLPQGASDADIIDRRDEIAVGKVVFLRDTNNRVYIGASSLGAKGPIERHYYVPRRVVGENRISWQLSHGAHNHSGKVPKKNPSSVFGRLDVDDDIWVVEHRYKLARKIQDVKDARLLREIGKLIGYREDGTDGQ